MNIKNIIREEIDDLDWIRDVEAIESPQVVADKGYVIWLDDIEEEEREIVGKWLFKKLPQCINLPIRDGYWSDKRVMTFNTKPCGVGGYSTEGSPEEARVAYDTWSNRMTPLDPIKILRGVNINESEGDDLDWIRNTQLSKYTVGDTINMSSVGIWRSVSQFERNRKDMSFTDDSGWYGTIKEVNIDLGYYRVGNNKNHNSSITDSLINLIEIYISIEEIDNQGDLIVQNDINESDDFTWADDIDPVRLIVNSFMEKVRIYKHNPYAYIPQWNSNITLLSLERNSAHLRDRFWDYMKDGIVQDLPLGLIKYVRDNGFSDETIGDVWDEVRIRILDGMDFNRSLREESDDLQWMDDIVPCDIHSPCIGMKWQVRSFSDGWFREIYTIINLDDKYMGVGWRDDEGVVEESTDYLLTQYQDLLKNGDIRQVD